MKPFGASPGSSNSIRDFGARSNSVVLAPFGPGPPVKNSIVPGGDLTLKSIDGQTFTAHSVLLALASPVFADMLEVGSPSPSTPVELAESGETIALMLKFIYPREQPVISSFDMLQKALHVAHKYELVDMQRQLRRELSQPGSATSVWSSPLEALSVASTFGLKTEARLAISQAQKGYDFTATSHLKELAKLAPASIPWVVLIGIPSVKSNTIHKVLFNFSHSPMRVRQSELMLCRMCKDFLIQTSGDSRYSPPEWQARWAHGLSKELKRRKIEDWKPCFDISLLFDTVSRHGGTPIQTPKGNCTCLDLFGKDLGLSGFLQWSSKVHDHLVARLEGLKDLEKLIE